LLNVVGQPVNIFSNYITLNVAVGVVGLLPADSDLNQVSCGKKAAN